MANEQHKMSNIKNELKRSLQMKLYTKLTLLYTGGEQKKIEFIREVEF